MLRKYTAKRFLFLSNSDDCDEPYRSLSDIFTLFFIHFLNFFQPMTSSFKLRSLLLLAALSTAFTAQAQNIFEGTKNWHGQAHSAWKIEPQAIQGYVIVGNRFFTSPNKDIYMSQFSELAQFNSWTRTHTTDQNLISVFWKSFCKSTYPVGYFMATSTTNNKAYTLTTNATGHKLWERVSNLPFPVTYGGVCQSTNGGYMGCGGNNNGNLAVTKFDNYGAALWTYEYPGSSFGWSIKAATGGGYVIAGTNDVTRIDIEGNLTWTRTLNPGISPDGSAYSYSEFEEITILPESQGFVVTGSTFSNSHSGIYTARLSWAGVVSWIKINDEVNTSLPNTPVCWVNNAILSNNFNTKVITSWRRGPVSAGGGMFARTVNIADGTQGPILSLGNNIPVREAFATRAHSKLVIGGTAGNLQSVYAYANNVFLLDNPTPQGGGQIEEQNIPLVATVLGFQTNVSAANPTFQKDRPGGGFDNPVMAFATRTAYQDLSIYPNPSTGLVYVGGVIEAGATLRVLDIAGRLVMEKTIQDGDAIMTFDLAGQPKGVYTVQMVGAQYNVTRKFVIE